MTDQERFMKEAIRQAKKAEALEEVPIGCVIVYEGKIIARGYNRRNTDKNYAQVITPFPLKVITSLSVLTAFSSPSRWDIRLSSCSIDIT